MKKGTILILLFATFLLSFAASALFQYESSNQTVAYVRSNYLIENFKGMREAREIFQEQQVLLSMQLDTARTYYQAIEQQFLTKVNTLSRNELDDLKIQAEIAKRDFQIKSKEYDKWMMENDKKMTQSVLNQVNSYVEDYGKKNGYNLILGTTSGGSILFGNDAMDITEDLLSGLNQQYLAVK